MTKALNYRLPLAIGLTIVSVLATIKLSLLSRNAAFIVAASSSMSIPQNALAINAGASVAILKRLPDFSQYKDVKQKKKAFFETLYPIIKAENEKILAIKKRLDEISKYSVAELNEDQQVWLFEVMQAFDVESDVIDELALAQLNRRVDIVPPSLALAQAAIESGWGSSRFARQGNNLFGQWCFAKGCGLVPSGRDDGLVHEVAKFDSVNDAVRSYIKNLNTNGFYTQFRRTRADLRENKQPVTGAALAETLLHYSEEGQHYVSKISNMIRQNKLAQYTRRFENEFQLSD